MKRKWIPAYYIVYKDELAYMIAWPNDCSYRCVANLANMLKTVIKKRIGSEMKFIWNDYHRNEIISKNNVTSEDIDNYVRSNTAMLSFMSSDVREKAVKGLIKLGANPNDFICVDSYRDVILQQSYYYKHKEFIPKQS